MKLKNYLITGAIGILLGLGFMAGWKMFPYFNPYPIVTHDTTYIIDNSWHSIKDSLELDLKVLKKRVAYYKSHRDTLKLPGDTIPIPQDVDTVAILRDYYSKYIYALKSENDSIAIKDSLIITQNTPVWNEISYKFKIPFTTINNTIDNTVTYNKYLQFGIDLPIYSYSKDSLNKVNLANIKLETYYIFPKGYIKAGWQPNTETFDIGVGTTIAKFKTQK